MNRLEHWNGTSSWFSKLLRVSLLGWLDSSGPYFTMQMKFATVSALLLFFVAAAPAAPDARNGLKIPLTKRATFIKENGVVDLETLAFKHTSTSLRQYLIITN